MQAPVFPKKDESGRGGRGQRERRSKAAWSLELSEEERETLNAFAFRVLGCYADNGSEHINHGVAELLGKLQISEFTKPRACRTTGNALMESKNAAACLDVSRLCLSLILLPRERLLTRTLVKPRSAGLGRVGCKARGHRKGDSLSRPRNAAGGPAQTRPLGASERPAGRRCVRLP